MLWAALNNKTKQKPRNSSHTQQHTSEKCHIIQVQAEQVLTPFCLFMHFMFNLIRCLDLKRNKNVLMLPNLKKLLRWILWWSLSFPVQFDTLRVKLIKLQHLRVSRPSFIWSSVFSVWNRFSSFSFGIHDKILLRHEKSVRVCSPSPAEETWHSPLCWRRADGSVQRGSSSLHFVHLHGCHLLLLLLDRYAPCWLTAGVLMVFPVLQRPTRMCEHVSSFLINFN